MSLFLQHDFIYPRFKKNESIVNVSSKEDSKLSDFKQQDNSSKLTLDKTGL